MLDTNILISSLISKTAAPHHIYAAWRNKRITVLICAHQLIEVGELTRRIAIALRIKPAEAGRLVNSLRNLAVMVNELPPVQRSPDPQDDFILALAEAGGARYVVTGDKSGLLALKMHADAEIVSSVQFVRRCRVKSPQVSENFRVVDRRRLVRSRKFFLKRLTSRTAKQPRSIVPA